MPLIRPILFLALLAPACLAAPAPQPGPLAQLRDFRWEPAQRAIADLVRTCGDRYPDGPRHARRLRELHQRVQAMLASSPDLAAARQLLREATEARDQALLDNPLLRDGKLLVIRRKPGDKRTPPGLDIGMPSNHECNSSLPRGGYDNDLCILSPIAPRGQLQSIHRPPDGGYIGEVDLHWDAQRLLFARSDADSWKVFEMLPDGGGLRQVSTMPDDVDSFDPCYLPNGDILFGSTASFQAVPCWHGLKKVSSLYRMSADGRSVRQICFDQDHDFHPTVLPNGQVLYHRWDYTGINHIFLRELMLMNPDGTGQRAAYGSNSWYPNSLYFPRPLPGDSGRLICILSGYHGVHRMGQLVLLDTSRGWHEASGIAQRISGRGDPIRPMVKDNLVDDDWPKFLHPYPLSEKHYLVSAWMSPKGNWGIYLADAFDNLVLVREEPGYALLEPIPLKPQPAPPVIPDRVDLARRDGLLYLHDIHAGPGLAGVPRGTVRSLRVIAYDFGHLGLAGPDLVGYGGPWEVMRILGTTPIQPDGSAFFRVPANTPIAIQPLDAEGKAVQLMRSWLTVMPGETASCVGCHEAPADTPPARLAIAAQREPEDLVPWRGPARGFDFGREVQPVIDRHCVGCHDGRAEVPLDLRSAAEVPHYAGRRISQMAIDRMHPAMRARTNGVIRYAPAYDALLPYIRRVGIEDDVSLLTPGEYHADTSPLIQMLRKNHQGVQLDDEAWDRLVTWIDLNAPCHGSWEQIHPIPDGAAERRAALRRQYGGPETDPMPAPAPRSRPERRAPSTIPAPPPNPAGWPFDPAEARQRQAALGPAERILDLGEGVTLKLIRIPAGEFLMGDTQGPPDERPRRIVIDRPFWIGACEITNEQFRRFDPAHDSRYYQKRYPPLTPKMPDYVGPDARGLTLNLSRQPAVRISWTQAAAFCQWLSARTGRPVDLPSEEQWEWACRAGASSPLFFGAPGDDFSRFANLADASFARGLVKEGRQITGGLEHLLLEGAAFCDERYNDQAVVTAEAGRYQPNPWGLFDMHGNAAEWTRSEMPNAPIPRRIVRGGSFFDPPARARSASRTSYAPWQRPFNVGFRVVCD